MKTNSLLSRFALHALPACLALAAAGCAGLPAVAPAPGTSTQAPRTAENLIAQGEYVDAAVIALDEAAMADGSARITKLETAAWAAARGDAAELIQQALTLYPNVTLSAEQQATRQTYQALLAALQENPTQALELIGTTARPNRARPLGDYWLTQALAYRLLDDGEAATLMLVRRDAQLSSAQRQLNHARLWSLQQESSRFLFADPNVRYDATTQGWLELGQIARRFWTDETAIYDALNQWQLSFPGHPAHEQYLAIAEQTALTTLHSAVRRIALLLPTSGRLAEAAMAVRDGFIAAHFADTATQLDVRIYDTGRDAMDAYDQAVADGAELIVGPLDKQQVEAVIQYNADRLPILALNYRDQSGQNPAVLEFGLSPEDDARSAALRALDDGLTHAIALVSDDEWGQRSLQAFREAFMAGGGVLLDASYFTGGPREYQNTIKSLLRLQESAARFEAIQRLVGEELDTAPVRRQDAQLVYLAATPTQGRQIRPQLRYYHAEDLPIYSGGRIYAGTPDPRQDKDLNGVQFCAMPWLLGSSETWRTRRAEVTQAWPSRARRYERLYAMGNDAYLLASKLRNANWSQLPLIPGATGELSRQQQRIVRTLPCTEFVGGVPQVHSAPSPKRGS